MLVGISQCDMRNHLTQRSGGPAVWISMWSSRKVVTAEAKRVTASERGVCGADPPAPVAVDRRDDDAEP